MICADCCVQFNQFWEFRQQVLLKQNEEISRINHFYEKMDYDVKIELYEVPNMKLISWKGSDTIQDVLINCKTSSSTSTTRNVSKNERKSVLPMNSKTKLKEAKQKLQKTKTDPEAFEYVSIDNILKKIKSSDSEDYSDESDVLYVGTSYQKETPAPPDPLSKPKKAKFDEFNQMEEIFDLT